eukprot:Skav227134  [mRNA]  locus=scaffold133:230198:230823:- [translate_table: standard]
MLKYQRVQVLSGHAAVVCDVGVSADLTADADPGSSFALASVVTLEGPVRIMLLRLFTTLGLVAATGDCEAEHAPARGQAMIQMRRAADSPKERF